MIESAGANGGSGEQTMDIYVYIYTQIHLCFFVVLYGNLHFYTMMVLGTLCQAGLSIPVVNILEELYHCLAMKYYLSFRDCAIVLLTDYSLVST